jgi:hypothetical protein
MEPPLSLDQLRDAVRAGRIDTVLLALTDMQGRLQNTAPRPATTCWPSTSR